MVEGLPSLVSMMYAQALRHELLANNLANVSTPGFKRDDLLAVPSVSAPTQSGAAGGAGVLPTGPAPLPTIQWTDFSQGVIRETGRDLDVALNGPGFLVVSTPAGPRYTRSGALAVGPDGTLVTGDGFPVLGQRGPIAVKSGKVTVGSQGEVREDGRVVDTLRVVDFPAPYRLLKQGGGLFAPVDPGAEPGPATGMTVAGGALESSNVNPVEAMVSMIDILRSYEAAQRAIQAIDQVNGQAVNEVGRIS